MPRKRNLCPRPGASSKLPVPPKRHCHHETLTLSLPRKDRVEKGERLLNRILRGHRLGAIPDANVAKADKRVWQNQLQTLRRWVANVRNLIFAESGGDEVMLQRLVLRLFEDSTIQRVLGNARGGKVVLNERYHHHHHCYSHHLRACINLPL